MSAETNDIRSIVKWQTMASAIRTSRRIFMERIRTPEFMHPDCSTCKLHGRDGLANYYFRPFGRNEAFIFACDHHASMALRAYSN